MRFISYSKPGLKCLLGLGLMTGVLQAASAASLDQFSGSWLGHFNYKDEPLALRLHVRPNEEPAVTVDYPQLVFSRQAAEWTVDEGRFIVSLPLGLGDASFSEKEGGLLAERTTESGLPITIQLSPDLEFDARHQDIQFGASDPLLEGTVTFPPGAGPFPLVILLAGSNEPHRGNLSYTSWSDHLARQGIASLAYDRRPDDALSAGGSLYAIDDHAADVAAAIELLSGDPRIDRMCIGLHAKSRGGWIALATAAREPRVAFVAGIGIAAVSIAQQDLQAFEARMRSDGLNEQDIQAALAYSRLYFHATRHPGDFGLLLEASKNAQKQEWGTYVRHPETSEDLAWFRAQQDFDPMTLISGISAPMFLAWGSEDLTAPAGMNRPLFESLLNPEYSADTVLKVYEGAGHSLEGPLNVDDDPEIVWSGMHPVFLAELDAWLQRITGHDPADG